MEFLSSQMNPIISVFDVRKIDTTEEYDKIAQWAELPSVPLERIYSFLLRKDQINMSQVCRKWAEGFNSPSVWKIFRFSLTESQLLTDPCLKIKCTEKYSKMFRHVEIDIIRNADEHVIETWCSRLKQFLDLLNGNKQITSFKLRWPETAFLWHTMACFKDLRNYIVSKVPTVHKTDSFENQPKQLKLEVQSTYFISQLGEFLKCIADDDKFFPPLLVLRRVVNPIEPVDQESVDISQSIHVLLCQRYPIFQSLTILQSDYSFVFERMPASQYAQTEKSGSLQLSKITVSCYGSIQHHHQGFTTESWGFLKQLKPDLKIKMYFETYSQSLREVEFFIVPDMPITQLDYNFTVCKLDHSSIMEIDALFTHLLACKIYEHLVSLRLAWFLPIPDLASTLFPFLQASTKLKSLQLFIIYPVNGIDFLGRSWLENRPQSLENVSIDISDVGNEENYSTLMNTVREYVPALRVKGLNLEVKLNFGKTIFRETS